ncbi:MAG: hypothetical protein ABIR47_03605 [Candidatus Kapaibacterium sp.]
MKILPIPNGREAVAAIVDQKQQALDEAQQAKAVVEEEAKQAVARAQGAVRAASMELDIAQRMLDMLDGKPIESQPSLSGMWPSGLMEATSKIAKAMTAMYGYAPTSINPIKKAIEQLGCFSSRGRIKGAIPYGAELTDAKMSELVADAFNAGIVARIRYGQSRQFVAYGLSDWVVRKGKKLVLVDGSRFPNEEAWQSLDRSKINVEFHGDIDSLDTVK